MHSEQLPASFTSYARSEFSVNSKKAERFSRSRQMVNALRQEFVYSEKRSRDILFEEIRGIITQGETQPTVSRLTREASFRSRMRAEQIGYDLSNWDTATKATVNAMLRSEALLSQNGSPIALTIAAPAAPVFALTENFEDATEGHLLEILIRKLGDVTVRDHTALAHALFRQFDRSISMEDLEDRVAFLLARLADRVVLASDGTYCAVAFAN